MAYYTKAKEQNTKDILSENVFVCVLIINVNNCKSVSYTHLDVYKRQFTMSLQGSTKERKRSFVVHSEGLEIINNITEKCHKENQLNSLTYPLIQARNELHITVINQKSSLHT